MKYFQPSLLLLLLGAALLFPSCDDDEDPVIPNEEELITTLIFTLTPDGGGAPVVWTFRDLDGDGGSAPNITTAPLAANTDYDGIIQFLNEIETPPEDITEEVEEEDEEHQVFYQVSGANLTVNYQDQDSAGNPLGVATSITTGDAGTGTLTITLLHEPDKSAQGVSDGDPANAGGETDIEVTFDVEIVQ